MKLSIILDDLKFVFDQHGDIDVQLQNTPEPNDLIVCHESFFLVVEEYEDGLWLNIRSWPY